MTANLHTVDTAPPEPDPDADTGTHLLTDRHAEAVLRLAALTLEAARAAGDHIDITVQAGQGSTRIEILVERR